MQAIGNGREPFRAPPLAPPQPLSAGVYAYQHFAQPYLVTAEPFSRRSLLIFTRRHAEAQVVYRHAQAAHHVAIVLDTVQLAPRLTGIGPQPPGSGQKHLCAPRYATDLCNPPPVVGKLDRQVKSLGSEAAKQAENAANARPVLPYGPQHQLVDVGVVAQDAGVRGVCDGGNAS